jgi:hypothetical protein
LPLALPRIIRGTIIIIVLKRWVLEISTPIRPSSKRIRRRGRRRGRRSG